jgi:hypothetical protein
MKSIIDFLTEALEKPTKYFMNALHCQGFIHGISFTVINLNKISAEEYRKTQEEVHRLRGWTWQANSYYSELKEKELPDIEIIKELLSSEIEILKIISNVE